MRLVWSPKFTRSARKLSARRPDLLDQFEAALHLLEREPYHPALRTHKLSGDFEGCWACSAGYDLRIVFEFVKLRKGAEMEIICSMLALTTRFTERPTESSGSRDD